MHKTRMEALLDHLDTKTEGQVNVYRLNNEYVVRYKYDTGCRDGVTTSALAYGFGTTVEDCLDQVLAEAGIEIIDNQEEV